jgi:hypothetical protein
MGQSVRYIALYGGSKHQQRDNDKQTKSAPIPATATIVAANNNNETILWPPPDDEPETEQLSDDSIIIHMFNPIDEQEEMYDTLDAEQMKELNIGLNFSAEHQDYRYNVSRGHYTLLRRTRMRISYQNEECRRLRPWINGGPVLCMQECFDLMRGIDVRERARMQFAKGVILNQQQFAGDASARPSCIRPPAPAMESGNKPIMRDELR